MLGQVNIRVDVVDGNAFINLSQTYKNQQQKQIDELIYQLPLFGAQFQLIGFEIKRNDNKKSTAKVKLIHDTIQNNSLFENQQQINSTTTTTNTNEQLNDAFQCTVTQLNPNETITFNSKFVTELFWKGKSKLFVLPSSFFQSSLQNNNQMRIARTGSLSQNPSLNTSFGSNQIISQQPSDPLSIVSIFTEIQIDISLYSSNFSFKRIESLSSLFHCEIQSKNPNTSTLQCRRSIDLSVAEDALTRNLNQNFNLLIEYNNTNSVNVSPSNSFLLTTPTPTTTTTSSTSISQPSSTTNSPFCSCEYLDNDDQSIAACVSYRVPKMESLSSSGGFSQTGVTSPQQQQQQTELIVVIDYSTLSRSQKQVESIMTEFVEQISKVDKNCLLNIVVSSGPIQPKFSNNTLAPVWFDQNSQTSSNISQDFRNKFSSFLDERITNNSKPNTPSLTQQATPPLLQQQTTPPIIAKQSALTQDLKQHDKDGFLSALESAFARPSISNYSQRCFIIISDGRFVNSSTIIRLISKNVSLSSKRLFSIGVGDAFNPWILDLVSTTGYGQTELISSKEADSISDLRTLITRQVERIFSTPRVDLTISWGGKSSSTPTLTQSNNEESILQYPSKIKAVYVGDFLTSYALFPKPQGVNSIQISLQQRSQTIERTELNLTQSKIQSGRTIHCLVAAGRLRELEDSLSSIGDPSSDPKRYEQIKQEIMKLGLEFSMASMFTAFSIPDDSKLFSLRSSFETMPKSQSVPISPLLTNPSQTPPPSSPATRKSYKLEVLKSMKDKFTELPKQHAIPANITKGSNPSSLGSNTAIFPSSNPNSLSSSFSLSLSTTPQTHTIINHNLNSNSTNALLPTPPQSPRSFASNNRSAFLPFANLRDSYSSSPPREKLNFSRSNSGQSLGPPPSARPFAATSLAQDDLVFRQAQGILNKLTIEKFDTLFEKLMALPIHTEKIMKKLINLLFDKAIMELRFSSMYSRLCKRITERTQQIEFDDSETNKKTNFRRLLISKVEQAFSNKPPKPIPPPEMTAQSDIDELEWVWKKKIIGTVRFLGHLYLEGMLSDSIIHACFSSSFSNPQTLLASEEEIERTCVLLETVGAKLYQKDVDKTEEYFAQLSKLRTNPQITQRASFMIANLVELKENDWVRRRKGLDPKTLAEARAELENEDDSEDFGRPRNELNNSFGRGSSSSSFSSSPSMGSNFSPVSTGYPRVRKTSSHDNNRFQRFPFNSNNNSGGNNQYPSNNNNNNSGSRQQTHQSSGSLKGGLTRSQEFDTRQRYESDNSRKPVSTSMGSNQTNNNTNHSNNSNNNLISNNLNNNPQGWSNINLAERSPKPGLRDITGASPGIGRGRGKLESGRSSSSTGSSPPISIARRVPSVDSDGGNSSPPFVGSNEFSSSLPSILPFKSSSIPTTTQFSSSKEEFAKPMQIGNLSKSGSRNSTPLSSDLDSENNEEQQAKIALLLEEFLASAEIEEAKACIEELKNPALYCEVISKAILTSIEGKDRDRQEISKLLKFVYDSKLFSSVDFIAGFRSCLDAIEDLELDIPMAPKYLASFFASAIRWNAITLEVCFGDLMVSFANTHEQTLTMKIAVQILTDLFQSEGKDFLAKEIDNINFGRLTGNNHAKASEILTAANLKFLVQ